MVDTQELLAARQEIIDKNGPWLSHDIELGAGVSTVGYAVDDWRARYVLFIQAMLQTATDISGKPLDQLRVLDLACMEGQYGLEFAAHGAQVLSIEGRRANIEKAVFAKNALGLKNIEFVQDDVRNLSREKYGVFDVVICAGILYHLTDPDVFSFLEKVHEVTDKLTILDTHISLTEHAKVSYKGHEYWGIYTPEHATDADDQTRELNVRASLDNDDAFWLTRLSLTAFLTRCGYTSGFEFRIPRVPFRPDRTAFALIKGQPQAELKTVPARLRRQQLTDEKLEIPHLAELHSYAVLASKKEFPPEFTVAFADSIENFAHERGIPVPAWVETSPYRQVSQLQAEVNRLQQEIAQASTYAQQLETEWQAKNKHIEQLESLLIMAQQAAPTSLRAKIAQKANRLMVQILRQSDTYKKKK